MIKIYVLLISALAVGACAKSADSISPAYVSPLQYDSYSCPQLREEAARVSARASQAIGEQNAKATNDAVATGVSAVIFWPGLFFIKGDGASAVEVSRLKGEMDAVEQASIRKNCGIQFQKT